MLTINENSTCADVMDYEKCNCSIGITSLFVKCNVSDSIFEGRFNRNKSASIECSGKPMENGTLNIGMRSSVQLRNCEYSSKPKSLRQMLDIFGSSNERSIDIKFDKYTIMDLSDNYFQGFRDLTTLRLDFGIENLPTSLFKELTMLERLTLTAQLKKLPIDLLINQNQLVELILKNNRIEEIPFNFFRHQNNLVHLDLSANRLQFIAEITFANLTSLIHLDMSQNAIKSVHANAFHNMKKLEYLSLKSNELTHVPPTLLKGLTLLANLDLSANQLRLLPPDLLRNQTQLFRSDLSKNDIETLPEMLFETNAALQYVNISHNSLITLPR